MATTIASEKIKFEYDTATLFDKVALRTAYMAKSLTTEKGESLSEEYAMTDDERDAFNITIESMMPEIQDIFLKQTSGVEDAFVLSDSKLSVTIKDYMAYNSNVVGMVDAALEDCIITGAARGWFEVTLRLDLFKLMTEQFDMKKTLLKRRLYQLKKMRAYPSS